MNSYKKSATIIQIFAIAIMLSNSILTITHWFFPLLYMQLYFMTGIGISRVYNVLPLSLAQRLCGFAVEACMSGLLIYALILLIRLMNNIKETKYFTLETICLLKKITKIALVYVIATPSAGTLLSVITTWHNQPGERFIEIGFGAQDTLNIMVFCVMFLMMSVFEKGYELKHEQDLTI